MPGNPTSIFPGFPVFEFWKLNSHILDEHEEHRAELSACTLNSILTKVWCVNFPCFLRWQGQWWRHDWDASGAFWVFLSSPLWHSFCPLHASGRVGEAKERRKASDWRTVSSAASRWKQHPYPLQLEPTVERKGSMLPLPSGGGEENPRTPTPIRNPSPQLLPLLRVKGGQSLFLRLARNCISVPWIIPKILAVSLLVPSPGHLPLGWGYFVLLSKNSLIMFFNFGGGSWYRLLGLTGISPVM